MASEEKVDPNVPKQHKIDPVQLHWKDFYVEYEAHISIVEVRKDRKLAMLNLPHKDKDAPFAFFIHGACARMGQFKALIKYLSQSFNIVAFDRIGCGYSDRPNQDNAYNGQPIFLDLCALFQTYAPVKKQILIISHSFGCSQSIRLYSKYGDASTYEYNIRSIVLMAPHPFILGEKLSLAVKGVMSLPYFVLDKMSASMSATFRKNAIYEKSTDVLQEEISFGGHNPSTMYSPFYLNLVPCSHQEFTVSCKYGVNILIIHGKHDALVALDKSKQVFDKFKALMRKDKDLSVEFELVDECSHQVMQEQPDIVNDLVNKFWTASNEDQQ